MIKDYFEQTFNVLSLRSDTMAQVLKINQDEFKNIVLDAQKPVLVDFWAEWCGPCRALAPVLEEVAAEVSENALVVKVNVDDNPELAQKFGIRGIPTLLYFKQGEVKNTLVGNQPKMEILKSLKELI